MAGDTKKEMKKQRADAEALLNLPPLVGPEIGSFEVKSNEAEEDTIIRAKEVIANEPEPEPSPREKALKVANAIGGCHKILRDGSYSDGYGKFYMNVYKSIDSTFPKEVNPHSARPELSFVMKTDENGNRHLGISIERPELSYEQEARMINYYNRIRDHYMKACGNNEEMAMQLAAAEFKTVYQLIEAKGIKPDSEQFVEVFKEATKNREVMYGPGAKADGYSPSKAKEQIDKIVAQNSQENQTAQTQTVSPQMIAMQKSRQNGYS